MSAFDPNDYRRASLQQWEGAATGWARWQAHMREFAGPVSRWMVDALVLEPDSSVLDLAAGIGESGFIAASRLGEEGRLVLADQAESMLAAARDRAQELGLHNVELRQLNAEALDLETASFDGVLCRWGFMLMADPAAAMRECRRVLRPGGRIALAVWGAAEHNPWVTVAMQVLVRRGLIAPPPAGGAVAGARAGASDTDEARPGGVGASQPGMFALSDPAKLAGLLEAAGFTGIAIESLALCRRHASFEEFWRSTLDASGPLHETVMARPAGEIEQIAAEVAHELSSYIAADGALAIPAETLVAKADA